MKVQTAQLLTMGYQIDHIEDFSLLGKMAARNQRYLFFADGDKVLCLQIH
ncbi:hypothetical protein [Bacillus cabrialesii]|uniref:Uncharacterized protein n=1 Tax=Bacillus cabrialesii subsp. tritici TaxID=2944916 RepID=A0ABT9DMQ2_9BACI|nr:hypothetical protein [Bacillus cabrialesii]MDO8225943.1 hypothetical protein [Bacillus cabrialesii subsp. tritici]